MYQDITIPNMSLERLSDKVLKDAFDAAIAENEDFWRNDRQKLLDFYRAQQLDDDRYVKTFFNGNTDPKMAADYPHNLILSQANLTAKLINKKAKTYKRQPTRLVDGKTNEQYQKFLRDIRIESATKLADRMTWLLGDHCLILVAQKDRQRVKVYQPPYFRPFFDPENPLEPAAVAYPSGILRNKQGNPILAWQLWTKTEHFILEEGTWNIVKREPNWHGGALNAIFTHRLEPLESFWTQDASDLIDTNRDVDVALTSINNAVRYHGFPKLAALGISQEEAAKVNIRFDKIVTIGPTAEGGDKLDLKYLDPNTDWTGLIETIKFRIELLAQTWNVDLRWDISGTIASGVALKILSIDNTDDLVDVQGIYEEHLERPLFELAKQISGAISWLKEIRGEELSVNWPEEELIESEKDVIEADAKELEMNLTNPIELMIEDDPDLDEAEAARRYVRNVRVNALVKRGGYSEADLMAALGDVSEEDIAPLLSQPAETGTPPAEPPTPPNPAEGS